MRLTTLSLEEVRAKIERQQAVIGQLKADIEVQQAKTEDVVARVEQERRVNKYEEERFRRLTQINATLKAKKLFIQEKYDLSTTVQKLNLDDFKTLMTSNDMVNSTVKDFVGRLDQFKDVVQKYEAMKQFQD